MKLNLLIDGSHFMRRMGIQYMNIEVVSELCNDDIEKIISFYNEQFGYMVNKLKEITNQVVIVDDDKSWRKQKFAESQGYKTNREYDNNYHVMKSAFNLFVQRLEKENRIVYSKVEGAEGDDLIFYWDKLSRKNGFSVFIFTSDKDLHQLINADDYTFTAVIDATQKTIYCPHTSTYWICAFYAKADDKIYNESCILKKYIKDKKYTNKKTTDYVVLFSKILCGDKSDNISSVYVEQKIDENLKVSNWGVTEKQAEAFIGGVKNKFKRYPVKDDIFNEEIVTDLINRVIKKKNLNSDHFDTIHSKLKVNTELVYLHEDTIPINVMELIRKEVKKKLRGKCEKIQISKKLSKDENRRWITDKRLRVYDPYTGRCLGLYEEMNLDIEDYDRFEIS